MYIVWKTACSNTEGSGACSIIYTKMKLGSESTPGPWYGRKEICH